MDAPFRTARGFVDHVEGQLGWLPPTGVRNIVMNVEAGRVKAKIAENPELYTWDNLAVTVAWLRAARRTVGPRTVVRLVAEALAATKPRIVTPRPSDIASAIAHAIATEQEARVEGWEPWVRRLSRAQGAGRDEVYEEWEKARDANL